MVRHSEMVPVLDPNKGEPFTEIDLQTGSRIIECRPNFKDKFDNLIERCVLARMRGMKVIGAYRDDNSQAMIDRLNMYRTDLQGIRFSDDRVYRILSQIVPDPYVWMDERFLSDFFDRFEDIR